MSTLTAPVAYPVHIDADLDPDLSRGLWLVKWLLAIPHYLVLALLWIAFMVLSIVAFFGILFSGRYPRAIFDFNVGVMRWSWRVAFYAYGALGTDRYPPFTLADVPDYPAHLEVDYPERLSRGLVLIKWWLLAIPHYLVLAFIAGGAVYGLRGANEEPLIGVSLIGILVLVAGIVLLFTGRYPRPVFDLILGLNRWALRVAGYVALMTDRYPPFSLEQGGHELAGPRAHALTIDPHSLSRTAAPQGGPTAPPHTAQRPAGAPASTRPVPGWTGGRVVSVVAGSLLVLLALALGGAGATLVVADQASRDSDGFLTSPSEELSSDGFAITSGDARIHAEGGSAPLPDGILGDVRLTAASAGPPIFLGIARTSDVEAYLADVQHDMLVEIRDGDPVYRSATGGAPSGAPADRDIWAAEATGADAVLTWPLEDGDWTVVVMNADGSAGVVAEVSAGAEVPWLSTVVAILFVLAGLTLLVGALLIAVPLRPARRD